MGLLYEMKNWLRNCSAKIIEATATAAAEEQALKEK